MGSDTPKHSAMAVTFLRALATHSPDTQLFNDPMAEKFLPGSLASLSKSAVVHSVLRRVYQRVNSSAFWGKAMPYWRVMGEVLLRARYSEEILQKGIEDGVVQYVLLGAGLDSFVFRKPELVNEIKVFELDLPETQKNKLNTMGLKGLNPSVNVTYLPIDFEKSAVSEVLASSDFDPSKPTLFNWNGVSYYLSRGAVESLFQDLSRFMGSQVEIVFDYADGRFFKSQPRNWRQKLFESFFSAGREPLKTGFYVDELEAVLEASGFQLLENTPGWEQEKLYSSDIIGIFPPSRLTHLAHAKGRS